MATATQVTAQQEVETLESELSTLRGKLATEQSTFEAFGRERSTLGERIAAGTARPEKASELARRTEIQQAAIEGLQAAIARKQTRLDAVFPELRRLQEEARLASLRQDVEQHQAHGIEVAKRINAKLADILAVDFPEYDAVRIELMAMKDPALAMQVRAALVAMGREVFDQGVPKAAADLLARGWRIRGDVVFQLKNLMPPKP